MRPQPIDETGPDAFKESVEHAFDRAMQLIALELTRAVGIEHAEFDLLGVV